MCVCVCVYIVEKSLLVESAYYNWDELRYPNSLSIKKTNLANPTHAGIHDQSLPRLANSLESTSLANIQSHGSLKGV